jgi:hypothetical protein
MLERRGKSRLRSRIGGVVASLFLAVVAPDAVAQDAGPQPAPAARQQGSSYSGPFEAIGRWLDQGARNFRDHWGGTKARVDDLNERAAANRKEMSERAEEMRKGAADVTIGAVEAVSKLPNTRVMSGRERCAVAPNGAPDCIAAAEALCRKHGFASGKSMDLTSAEECPVRALVAGRAEVECTIVTFISRAMCQ